MAKRLFDQNLVEIVELVNWVYKENIFYARTAYVRFKKIAILVQKIKESFKYARCNNDKKKSGTTER